MSSRNWKITPPKSWLDLITVDSAPGRQPAKTLENHYRHHCAGDEGPEHEAQETEDNDGPQIKKTMARKTQKDDGQQNPRMDGRSSQASRPKPPMYPEMAEFLTMREENASKPRRSPHREDRFDAPSQHPVSLAMSRTGQTATWQGLSVPRVLRRAVQPRTPAADVQPRTVSIYPRRCQEGVQDIEDVGRTPPQDGGERGRYERKDLSRSVTESIRQEVDQLRWAAAATSPTPSYFDLQGGKVTFRTGRAQSGLKDGKTRRRALKTTLLVKAWTKPRRRSRRLKSFHRTTASGAVSEIRPPPTPNRLRWYRAR